MSKPYEVLPEHIGRLGAIDLQHLLGILLYAESRKIKAENIHAPLCINVCDGGEDGLWEGENAVVPFIPAPKTLYQTKATAVSPAVCKTEIVKTRPLAMLTNGGCVCFFCGKQYVNNLISKRISAARAKLRKDGHPFADTAQIRFLDGSQIAAWTNRHLSAIIFVNETTSAGINSCLRSFRSWSSDFDDDPSYQTNDYLLGLHGRIRGELVKPKAVIRLIGSTGVGKSRLAFEALKIGQATESYTYGVVYVDAETAGESWLNDLRVLVQTGCEAVLVVDNCQLSFHQALQKIVGITQSGFSLLTIDYVPDPRPSGYVYEMIDPKQLLDVVEKMVFSNPDLAMYTDDQKKYIATLAYGYPRFAALIAKIGGAPSFADFNQEGIAEKLVWGRDVHDDRTWKAVTALSLFEHVGFFDEHENNRKVLADIFKLDLNPQEFYERIKPFIDRRVVQKVGSHVMVTPLPLAVAMAARWWDTTTLEMVRDIIEKISVAKWFDPFCDRIHQLDLSENAQRIVAAFFSHDSPFSRAEWLVSETGSRLFRAFSEVNPSATLDALYNALIELTPDEIKNIHGGRRHIMWALEKLCFQSETFSKATEILLLFATGENEGNANNATGNLKRLYHIYLPGTEVPAKDRLTILETILAGENDQKKYVAVEVLGAALENRDFFRMGGSERRGSSLPRQDWQPKLYNEIFEYWQRAFLLLANCIEAGPNPLAEKAKDALGENIDSILECPLIFGLEERFKSLAEKMGGYWPKALDKIQFVIDHPTTGTDDKWIGTITRWRSYVSPNSLQERMHAIITQPTWRHEKDADGNYIDLAEIEAERFTKELHASGREWWTFLPTILQSNQRMAIKMGIVLGGLEINPKEFVVACISALQKIPKEKRNAGILAGFLGGTKNRELVEAVLNEVAADDSMVDILVPLTLCAGVNYVSMERVVICIEKGKIEARYFRSFALGSASDDLSAKDICSFAERIINSASSESRRESIFSVHDVIHMYCHRRPDCKVDCKEMTKQLLLEPEALAGERDPMEDFRWSEDMLWIIENDKDANFLHKLLTMLIGTIASERHFSMMRQSYAKILIALFQNHPKETWSEFATALKMGGDIEKHNIIRQLGQMPGFRKGAGPFNAIPWEYVEPFLRENPEIIGNLLGHTNLFTVVKANDGSKEAGIDEDRNGEYEWDEQAIRLMSLAVELKQDVMGEVASSLWCFGSWGSRVPYLQHRIRLAKKLESYDIPQFTRWSKEIVAAFEKEVARAMKRDEEHAVGIYRT